MEKKFEKLAKRCRTFCNVYEEGEMKGVEFVMTLLNLEERKHTIVESSESRISNSTSLHAFNGLFDLLLMKHDVESDQIFKALLVLHDSMNDIVIEFSKVLEEAHEFVRRIGLNALSARDSGISMAQILTILHHIHIFLTNDLLAKRILMDSIRNLQQTGPSSSIPTEWLTISSISLEREKLHLYLSLF